MQRRTYLKTIGGSAVPLVLAGCTGGDGGDGGDGDDGDGDGGEPTETPEPTETATPAPTTITPGTAPGFPPFEMNEGGELVGFDIDLLSAVVEEADGYQLGEWQTFDFDSLIPALTSNNIDVVAAAMSITDQRDETIDFTDPYFSVNQAVIVRDGGDFSPSELADLSGHMVGSQSGTTGEGIVQNLIDDGTLSESNYNSYDSYVFAAEDLQNGNIDAVVLDVPVAESFANQRPVEIAFTVETGESYGFGIREGESGLQSALNSGLASIRDSGRYEEIVNEWFGGDSG